MVVEKRSQWVLIATILLATWLRFHHLELHSFWNDEGNSARLSERSIVLILEGTASDVHPPIYYLLLHGWQILLGQTEFALRSMSAFTGVLLVTVTIPLAKQLSGRYRIILLTTLFVGINPSLIWYSQEARMYMLLPLFAIASTVAIGRLSPYLYVLLITAGLYTHYFFPIVIVLHSIMIIINHRSFFTRWLLLISIASLFYLPWIPSMINGMGGNRGIPIAVHIYLSNIWHFLLTGFYLVQSIELFVLLFALLMIGCFWQLSTNCWRNAIMIGVLISGPITALGLLGATDAAFYKFVLLCVPFIMIWLSAGMMALWHGRFKTGKLVALLIGGCLLHLSSTAIIQQWHNPQLARDNYRGIADEIARENDPNAAIILNAPNQWEVFTYYHQDGIPVYPLPMVREKKAVIDKLEMIASQYSRLYTLYWGDAQQDPEKWVEKWLQDHTFKTSEKWVGDVRFVVYSINQEISNTIQLTTESVFNNMFRLEQIKANHEIKQGDIIEIEMKWITTSQPTQRYKLFAHLVDEKGNLVAQKDSEPIPITTEWSSGEIHTLKAGITTTVPAGRYQLLLGWYDRSNPSNRLLLSDGTNVLSVMDIVIKDR